MKEKRNAKIIKTPDLLSYSARQQKKRKTAPTYSKDIDFWHCQRIEE